MKTTVTGGTGFIGSHLAKRLVVNGRKVIATRNSPPDEDDNLAAMGVKVESCQVDLRNYHDTFAVIKGSDSVFHLAAHVGNMVYLHSNRSAELYTLQSNLLIDANVLRACIETGVKRIVYASSCAVYPMDKQMAPDAVFNEREIEFTQSAHTNSTLSNINPDGGYGWSKLMAEMQLNWANGFDVSIARLFNIYGDYECIGEKAHAVGDLTRRVIVSPEGDFIVYGDGNQSRDFLYISDCIDALLKLEEKASNPPLTVNIGSGEATNIRSLAQKIVTISGKKLNLVFDAARQSGPVSRTADISKARSSLVWEPEVGLDEGLKRTYAWTQRKLVKMQA